MNRSVDQQTRCTTSRGTAAAATLPRHWYLRYPLAYQHVAEMLAERGLAVDASCIWRWVQAYAPELNKRCRAHLRPTNKSYRIDETYSALSSVLLRRVAADEIWPDNLDLNGTYELPESKGVNLERRIGTGLYTLGAMPVEYSFFGDQYRAEWQAEAANVSPATRFWA